MADLTEDYLKKTQKLNRDLARDPKGTIARLKVERPSPPCTGHRELSKEEMELNDRIIDEQLKFLESENDPIVENLEEERRELKEVNEVMEEKEKYRIHTSTRLEINIDLDNETLKPIEEYPDEMAEAKKGWEEEEETRKLIER